MKAGSEDQCLDLFLRPPKEAGRASQVALVVKNLPASAGDLRDTGSIPWSGRPLREGHWQPTLVLLPGESLWAKEPGRLLSIRSKRIGHTKAT